MRVALGLEGEGEAAGFGEEVAAEAESVGPAPQSGVSGGRAAAAGEVVAGVGLAVSDRVGLRGIICPMWKWRRGWG